MRPTKISTHLILLSVLLLCLGFFMTIFINRAIATLKNDAEVINQIGIIRGSIQRLVKLELSGRDKTSAVLIEAIDEQLQRFMVELNDRPQREREKQIAFHLRNTARAWQELKTSLSRYRQAPSAETRRQLLAESEEIWAVADAAVLAAQQLTEYKVAKIRLFYLVLALNAANALLVLWVVYAHVRKRIEYQATHDPLTNLLNRRSFEQAMQSEISRSKRYGHCFSLIMLDIDHFKRINDSFGHKAGDQVLSILAQLVKPMMRQSDQVYRIGGEEFAIVASETPGPNAVSLAEKIRREVEGHAFGPAERVTVSMGVAEWQPGDESADLFRNADKALYQAKESGRNRTCLYS